MDELVLSCHDILLEVLGQNPQKCVVAVDGPEASTAPARLSCSWLPRREELKVHKEVKMASRTVDEEDIFDTSSKEEEPAWPDSDQDQDVSKGEVLDFFSSKRNLSTQEINSWAEDQGLARLPSRKHITLKVKAKREKTWKVSGRVNCEA